MSITRRAILACLAALALLGALIAVPVATLERTASGQQLTALGQPLAEADAGIVDIRVASGARMFVIAKTWDARWTQVAPGMLTNDITLFQAPRGYVARWRYAGGTTYYNAYCRAGWGPGYCNVYPTGDVVVTSVTRI